MSTSEDEPPTGISDEQLPDDLVPGDDNPLASGLEDGETVGDLLEDGKPPEESEESSETSEDSKPSGSDASQDD